MKLFLTYALFISLGTGVFQTSYASASDSGNDCVLQYPADPGYDYDWWMSGIASANFIPLKQTKQTDENQLSGLILSTSEKAVEGRGDYFIQDRVGRILGAGQETWSSKMKDLNRQVSNLFNQIGSCQLITARLNKGDACLIEFPANQGFGYSWWLKPMLEAGFTPMSDAAMATSGIKSALVLVQSPTVMNGSYSFTIKDRNGLVLASGMEKFTKLSNFTGEVRNLFNQLGDCETVLKKLNR